MHKCVTVKDLSKGTVTLALLGVLSRAAEPRYGYQIAKHIEASSNGATLTGIVYMLLQLPLGILYFTMFTFLIALSGALILAPLADVGFQINTGNVIYDAPAWLMPFIVVAGSLIFVATMHLAKFIGRMHGALAKSLLLGI